jgi:acetoin utilization protein AcuA
MQQFNTRRGSLTIDSQCSQEKIQQLGMDEGLGFFWHNRPDLQKQALEKIAGTPGGRVAVAHTEGQVMVGYVTITFPDVDERWGKDKIRGLYELGGIEIGREWRGMRVGDALLASLFPADAYGDSIVIATGYRWCWDTETAGLTVREYRQMLNKMFGRYGFQSYETDEPNIAWYPDNALMARIGSRVTPKLLGQFRSLLFERPGADYVSSEFLR